jgi:hypothetical protein
MRLGFLIAIHTMLHSSARELSEAGARKLLEEANVFEPTNLTVHKLRPLLFHLGHVHIIKSASQVYIVKKLIRPPFRVRRDVMHSYYVELNFYRDFAPRLLAGLPGRGGRPGLAPIELPRPLLIKESRAGFELLLTFVHGKSMSPYAGRSGIAAMRWLAGMHARFWGVDPRSKKAHGLNRHGGYWALSNQKQAHSQMTDVGLLGRLKRASRAFDSWLRADDGQTIVQGDAKKDQFKFTTGCVPCAPAANATIAAPATAAPAAATTGALAATSARPPVERCTPGEPCVARMLDYQWAGVGHHTRDLVHLLHCYTDRTVETQMLAHYAVALAEALRVQGITPPSFEPLLISMEVAWADLFRWVSAKRPGPKYRARMEARTAALLDKLDGGRLLNDENEYVRRLYALFPARGHEAQLVRAAFNGSEAWSGELSAQAWRSIGVPNPAALKARAGGATRGSKSPKAKRRPGIAAHAGPGYPRVAAQRLATAGAAANTNSRSHAHSH